jgi:hypothetical protein
MPRTAAASLGRSDCRGSGESACDDRAGMDFVSRVVSVPPRRGTAPCGAGGEGPVGSGEADVDVVQVGHDVVGGGGAAEVPRRLLGVELKTDSDTNLSVELELSL